MWPVAPWLGRCAAGGRATYSGQGTRRGHGIDGTRPQKGRRGWRVLAVPLLDKNNLGFTCRVSVQGLMKSKGDVGGSWHGWPGRVQKAAEV